MSKKLRYGSHVLNLAAIKLLKRTVHECMDAGLRRIREREDLDIVSSSKTEDAEEV